MFISFLISWFLSGLGRGYDTKRFKYAYIEENSEDIVPLHAVEFNVNFHSDVHFDVVATPIDPASPFIHTASTFKQTLIAIPAVLSGIPSWDIIQAGKYVEECLGSLFRVRHMRCPFHVTLTRNYMAASLSIYTQYGIDFNFAPFLIQNYNAIPYDAIATRDRVPMCFYYWRIRHIRPVYFLLLELFMQTDTCSRLERKSRKAEFWKLFKFIKVHLYDHLHLVGKYSPDYMRRMLCYVRYARKQRRNISFFMFAHLNELTYMEKLDCMLIAIRIENFKECKYYFNIK